MSNRQFKDLPASSSLNGIVLANGASAATSRKVNLTAVVDPGVNDDSGSGYGIMSIWCNTASNKIFICANATPAGAVWKDASGSGGIKETITVANAFAAGDIIKRTGGGYAKAQADSSGNAEVFGIVESADAASFVVVYTGKISLPSHGFTIGDVLFLSSAVAGLLTATEPTASGTVSKPVAIVSDANDLIVVNFRGIIQNPTGYGYTATALSGNVTLTKGSSTVDQLFSGVLGGAYTINLSRTGAQNGDKFLVYLSSVVTSAVNTLTFQENGSGSLKIFNQVQTLNKLLIFEYTGSAWILAYNQDSSLVDLLFSVTGVLPIANGGTGQSVRADAFDGLAPVLSVQGDIMYHDGTHWVRLPKGTSGQNLVMGATIPAWSDPAGFSTGDGKLTLKTVADSGWVLADDGTIGDATSGGSTRANADTSALFALLWNNVSDTYAPVSSGRGANAAADFAAHKKIGLTKQLGRSLCIGGAGSGLTSRALGQTLGEENHTLSTGEMPAHTHAPLGNKSSGPLSNPENNYDGNTGGYANSTDCSMAATSSTGGGGSHNNMQPSTFWNVMIKL